jgi:tetratricopeptide (TPR) repeat protein
VGEQGQDSDWSKTLLRVLGTLVIVAGVPWLLQRSCGLPESMIADTRRLEGNYDQAIEEFTAIINRYPGISAVAPDYNRRGQSYQGKGDFDRAIADFDEAIRLKPDFSEAYFNRCDTLRRIGNIDRALADCEQAARLKADYPDPRDMTLRMLFGRGDIDAARDKVDESIAVQLQTGFSAINQRFYRGPIRLFYDNRPAEAAEDFAATLTSAFDYRVVGETFGVQDVDGIKVSDLMGVRHPFVPDAYYAVLWLRMARARAGQDYAKELDENVEKLGAPIRRKMTLENMHNVSNEVLAETLRPWPGWFIALYLGKLAPEKIRAVAEGSADQDVRRRRLCDVDFYVAEHALEKGSSEEGRRLLQAAADGCPATALEYGFAKAELKRLAASGRD